MLDAKSFRNTETVAATPAHAPADHPKVKPARVGILIANLGTPDGYDYWSMRRYLSEFLSDKRVVDYSAWLWQPLLQLVILSKRPFSSGANYKSIWNHELNESPLLTITKAQTAKIRGQMQARYGDEVMVDFCMRYGNPSTKAKVREMVEAGCTKILFFPLYPHYAGATSATANDQFFRALMEEKWQPVARVVPPYFEDKGYIEALAQSIETAYAAAEHKPDMLSVPIMVCRSAICARATPTIASARRRRGCCANVWAGTGRRSPRRSRAGSGRKSGSSPTR